MLWPQRVELLEAIKKISINDEYNAAPVMDIASKLGKTRVAVAKLLWLSKKKGLVENPIRGRWRLTDFGKKALIEAVEA